MNKSSYKISKKTNEDNSIIEHRDEKEKLISSKTLGNRKL